MDLGISGRRAIVCASSKGLGRACAEALLAEGVQVVINGRDPERLARTAEELRVNFRPEVIPVVADVTTSAGRAALLAACPDPDILVNNNAGPEPGPFSALDEDDWLEALAANMVAPLQLVRAVIPAMIARKFGRIVNITSAMVTTPRTNMGLSSGPRVGLTAALKEQFGRHCFIKIHHEKTQPLRVPFVRSHFTPQKSLADYEARKLAAEGAQMASVVDECIARQDEEIRRSVTTAANVPKGKAKEPPPSWEDLLGRE